MRKRTKYLWIAGLGFLCFLTKTDLIQAQITSDGTLSTKVLTTNNLDFTIINGNRVGNNLFHSFKELSVPTGGSASFSNDLNVQNIISRVTGGSISNIDGLLKTRGSANLFLINPNGIIFGQNASLLNVNGSFVTSTASNLIFADGTQFSATNLETPPLLTVSVPIGLQFGQIAQPIKIEGSTLRVMPGNTLALLGGDVLVKGGTLRASAGRIELGSVAPNSLVSLNSISEGWAFGYEGVQNFRDIQISQTARIRTTGEGNGAIQLRGKKIAIADESQVIGFTLLQKPGQPLVIKASESVEVSGSSQLVTGTAQESKGAASDIKIETKRLIVRDGGLIDASSNGSGAGGNITVNASESVQLLGNGIYTSLGTQSLGTNNDAGNAGTVNISTGKLILRDGGRILTSTVGAGNAGTLRIDASESVEASGRSLVDADLPSGLVAETRNRRTPTIATGNAGDLIINTQRLLVQDGASISSAAINGSTGKAGRLDINASNSVTVTGTGIDRNGQIVPSTLLATSEGSGSAGGLRINTNKLTVRDGAQVSVSSTGSGNAGNLEITSGVLLLDNQGKLRADTTAGEGNINLRSLNLILRRGSAITTNARGDNITGGNINIDAKNGFIVAVPRENSNISANSADFRGGNVTINASGIFGTKFRNPDTLESKITATGANPSLSGNVQINTPNLDPTSGLVELSSDLVDRSRLIAQGCPANRGDVFTITGRGGLPPLPTDVLRSNQTATINWVTEGENGRERERGGITKVSGSKLPNQMVAATGWVINNKGEVTLIASAPNNHINNFLSTPTACPNQAPLSQD